MTAARWKPFPHPAKAFTYPGASLKKHWDRLHRGDCEPYPKDAGAQAAWRLFHQGRFADALAAGLEAGGGGVTAANKAQAIYATYVETRAGARLALFEEVMQRAEAQARSRPKDANAHYLYAYAAGRYSQGISVARALAQGFGGKVRAALEATLALRPRHAEAHTAMGAYHAEIIDKVGALVGGLTYGAKRDAALAHFRKALELAPDSPIASVEMARGLALLDGRKSVAQAETLFARAAAMTPRDAMEKLDVEAARAGRD
ncbi:MAG TPA: hypothetical protein VLC53_02265 [Myxococcota bacterium]|nr:hypothetical protein [Myxococcota bacterium]